MGGEVWGPPGHQVKEDAVQQCRQAGRRLSSKVGRACWMELITDGSANVLPHTPTTNAHHKKNYPYATPNVFEIYKVRLQNSILSKNKKTTLKTAPKIYSSFLVLNSSKKKLKDCKQNCKKMQYYFDLYVQVRFSRARQKNF